MVDTFQTSVNAYLAPWKKGGWTSANPIASLLPPSNGDLAAGISVGWTSGPAGVTIGQFAFADTGTGIAYSYSPGTGALEYGGTNPAVGSILVGFVPTEGQISLITAYLGGDTYATLPNEAVSLISRGDVAAQFAAGATVGQFVFASLADGSAIAQSSQTPPTTTFLATTNTTTALTAVGAGAEVGMPVSGAGIPAGAYLTAYNATAATATLSAAATASAAGITVTGTTAVYTGYRVGSVAAAGGLAKITAWG